MTGRGRPKLGEPVMIRLPADTIASLDRQAAADGVSRAELVRRIIAQWGGNSHDPVPTT